MAVAAESRASSTSPGETNHVPAHSRKSPRAVHTVPRLVEVSAPQAEGGRTGQCEADLVARVRREIADGTYDTPDKWEAALERLLARLDWP